MNGGKSALVFSNSSLYNTDDITLLSRRNEGGWGGMMVPEKRREIEKEN